MLSLTSHRPEVSPNRKFAEGQTHRPQQRDRCGIYGLANQILGMFHHERQITQQNLQVEVVQLIKTTVAQVLLAKEGETPDWSYLGCGVVCLIKEDAIHTHFLRLYCVKRAKLLWEQELYIPFKYMATCTFFHTFPADSHQVGLNFANETEAKEFHLAVKDVQRHQEMMPVMRGITNCVKSTSGPSDSGIKLPDSGQHFPFSPSTTTAPTTGSKFTDLDSAVKSMLIPPRFTVNDVPEAEFGRLKDVNRELRNRGQVSQTLPRSARASVSLALKKGPLPPVPCSNDRTTSQQTPKNSDPLSRGRPWVPSPPPPLPSLASLERIQRSASFQPVGSSTAAEKGERILTAMREVFRQKQLLQLGTDGNDM